MEVYSQLSANIATHLDSVWVVPTGGHGPYQIRWEDGNTNGVRTRMAHGWHYVTITDSAGCFINDSVEVIIPEIEFSVTGTDATCLTCSDGTATASVTQGIEPYYYQWSNGATTATVDNLIKGWHFITVRDGII